MPDPAKVLAGFKPEGGPRVIAARVRGVLKSAFTGPPDAAGGPEAAGQFPGLQGADRRARRTWSWWPTPTSWPTGSGCGSRDFFGQPDRHAVRRQRAVRRQPDRHAGRRRRADRAALPRRHQPAVHPGRRHAERRGGAVPPDRAGAADASGRRGEAAADAAHQRVRRSQGDGDHPRAARGDRRGAQGYPADTRRSCARCNSN